MEKIIPNIIIKIQTGLENGIRKIKLDVPGGLRKMNTGLCNQLLAVESITARLSSRKNTGDPPKSMSLETFKASSF